MVCDRWRLSFVNFCDGMGERPPGFTIERIDVNGNYEPKNCKWVSKRDQQRNRTTTKLSLALAREIAERISGRNKSALAREYGVSKTMIRRIGEGKAWQ